MGVKTVRKIAFLQVYLELIVCTISLIAFNLAQEMPHLDFKMSVGILV
jgi:hypothetical protein